MPKRTSLEDTLSRITEEDPLQGFVGAPSPFTEREEDYLKPMHGRLVFEPATYRSLFILDTLDTPSPTTEGPDKEAARKKLDPLVQPIDPFDDDKLRDADLKPAVGVLTVHEQTWEQTDLALGNLLQSICLAPGEVTQVAVVDWKRRVTATSSELTEQAESVTSQAEQDRAVNQVQHCVAQETQWGSSATSARSTSSQTGVSGGFLWFGGSASSATTESSVLTAQFSAGNRNVAAESTDHISQRTAEHSQALRSRRQSVIREVSEQESESLSTRVLANYNRRHTLNILFFEVLQRYKVRTRMKQWERCLFVPMKPIDFLEDSSAVEKHRASLLKLFSELGAREMFELLSNQLSQQQEDIKKKLSDLDQQIIGLREAKELADRFVSDRIQLRQRIDQVADMKQRLADPNTFASVRTKLQHHLPIIESYVAEYSRGQQDVPKEWANRKLNEKYGLIDNAAPLLEKMLDELVAKRAAIRLPIAELLNQNRLFLSQQLWLRMSPYRIFRVLQNYRITYIPKASPNLGLSQAPVTDQPPGTDQAPERDRLSDEQPLSTLVDPQPVGVFGNYLAFRWGFKNSEERMTFQNEYFGDLDKSRAKNLRLTVPPDGDSTSYESEETIGLPTSGVFAEAVLGRSLAAEKVDESFGKWADKDNMIPILPPKIADLQSRDRHHDVDLKAQDFASSLAQLRAEKLADVSHLDSILAAVGKGEMFRNMGGLENAVKLAESVAKLSEEGATKAGDRAAELQKKMLETFEKALESEAGQAMVSEFLCPSSGAALTRAKKDGGQKKEEGEKKKS